MKRIIDKDGKERWVNDQINIEGKIPTEYVRAFTLGETDEKGRYVSSSQIFEKPNGSFILQNGDPVKDIKMFDQIPPEHRERARAWFNNFWGKEEPQKEESTNPESFECLVCGKKFTQRIALSGHMRSHNAKSTSTDAEVPVSHP